MEDLKYVVRQRDTLASYDGVSLKQLEYTYAIVTTGAQPVAGPRCEEAHADNSPATLWMELKQWKDDLGLRSEMIQGQGCLDEFGKGAPIEVGPRAKRAANFNGGQDGHPFLK